MSVQGAIVTVLVVLAAVYVAYRLGPRRWRRRFGIGRHGSRRGGGHCGCNDCPATPRVRRPGH